jgi:L-lactate dehydrogenase complex protein LldG
MVATRQEGGRAMSRDANPVLEAVRRALGRDIHAPLAPRPSIPAPRAAGDVSVELDRLLREIAALSGVTAQLKASEIDAALGRLVSEQEVRHATLWLTPRLGMLQIEDRLRKRGVEIVSPHADKREMAICDLGVTEVDFALPETGTLCLLSSAQKPRAVSLLPRIHLAILSEDALRADLNDVFAEAREAPYLSFVSGPSRTADIELTVALGVHGPQGLFVWAVR